jgi:hypothetical protein
MLMRGSLRELVLTNNKLNDLPQVGVREPQSFGLGIVAEVLRAHDDTGRCLGGGCEALPEVLHLNCYCSELER